MPPIGTAPAPCGRGSRCGEPGFPGAGAPVTPPDGLSETGVVPSDTRGDNIISVATDEPRPVKRRHRRARLG
ncbi:MAG: hypothetical protein KME26_11835 [Oscillatoria princeps RMCB-10]|nr:hypothetical protein [Oscillatoria princeps RMCB-10]